MPSQLDTTKKQEDNGISQLPLCGSLHHGERERQTGVRKGRTEAEERERGRGVRNAFVFL